MKKISVLIAALLLVLSTSLHAAIVDAENPFFHIGSSEDNAVSIFIGAYKEYFPIKTQSGDIVIRAMLLQNIEEPNHPKGQQYEYVILANCEQHMAKIITIWQKPKEGEPGIPMYNLNDKKELSKVIIDKINKSHAVPVDNETVFGVIVTSGCNFIKGVDKIKPKKTEWKTNL